MSDDFNTVVLAALMDLQRGQADLRAGLTDLRADVAGLQRGQADLRAGLTDLRADVVGLQRGQADLRADLKELRTDVADLRQMVHEHRVETSAMRIAIMERIDRLQDDLAAAKDSITVNAGGTDRLWRAIAADRDTIEGLREIIFSLQRKISNLQDRMGFGPQAGA